MIDFKRGVQLEPICRRDLEMIRGWRNDPAIWKWCRQNDVIADIDQEKWFERQASDPTVKMYLIRGHGEAVGVCGLTSIDLWNHRAEFSLYIQPKEMKKHYGKKSLETLLHHAFSNLGLHLVWGETFAENPARKLFVQLGFKHDGERIDFYFKDGRYISAGLYSITREEWNECSTQATSSV